MDPSSAIFILLFYSHLRNSSHSANLDGNLTRISRCLLCMVPAKMSLPGVVLCSSRVACLVTRGPCRTCSRCVRGMAYHLREMGGRMILAATLGPFWGSWRKFFFRAWHSEILYSCLGVGREYLMFLLIYRCRDIFSNAVCFRKSCWHGEERLLVRLKKPFFRQISRD
jgi:hypothetical protein